MKKPSRHTHRRRSGFAMVIALTMILLIGVAIYVLTGISNSLLRQATTAQLQATEQNLTASAIAWAKINAPPHDTNLPTDPIQLNTTNLTPTDANLTITFASPRNGKPTARIDTRCTRAQYTFTKTRRYEIPE